MIHTKLTLDLTQTYRKTQIAVLSARRPYGLNITPKSPKTGITLQSSVEVIDHHKSI